MLPLMSDTVHEPGYQRRDAEVVDYELYTLGQTGLRFRGPDPVPNLEKGGYIACVGAAQTFGCFCNDPFPTILASELHTPVLNLGYGGAGPGFFRRRNDLLSYMNESRVVVVQVMSARSVDNSLFESGGLEYLVRRSDGARLSADEAYSRLITGGRESRESVKGRLGESLLRRLNRLRLHGLVAETRANWIADYAELLERITSPTVLLWFSKRSPDYRISYRSLSGFFGDFPQLVDREMVESIRARTTAYVECTSSRGSPQRLRSRFTGEPVTVEPAQDRDDFAAQGAWTHNHYYPSPEMHEDAAARLSPTLRRLMSEVQKHT